MEDLRWDNEGYIIKTDADGTEWRLVATLGPRTSKKLEQLKKLQEELEQLEAKEIEIRIEQQGIVQSLATRSNISWSP